MKDRMTKFLLAAIALALWGLLFKSLLAPAPVKAQGLMLRRIQTQALMLMDEKGERRMFLGAGEGGSFLSLYDKKGKERIVLSTLVVPFLILKDDKGGPRIILSLDEKGTPELELKTAKEAEEFMKRVEQKKADGKDSQEAK